MAAIGAVGTVLLEFQNVLINPVWGGLLGVVLVYVALLLLESKDVRRQGVGRWAGPALAALSVGAACLLSEYGVLASFVVLVFLVARDIVGWRVRNWWRLLIIIGPASAGYALIVLFADYSIRRATRPGHLLEISAKRLIALPFITITETWQGLAGNLLARVGRLEAESLASLTVAVGSLIGTSLVYWLLRRGSGGKVGIRRPVGGREAGALLAAAAAGLLVMAMARRVPWAGVTSRFYLPVAPLIACLSLWCVLQVTRSAVTRGVVTLLTYAVVFGTVADSVSQLAERQQVGRLAATIEPNLDPLGFTLVVLLQPEADALQRQAAGYELTARVAERLNPDLRRRLWVMRFEAMEDEGATGVSLIGSAEGAPELNRPVRGLQGRVGVTRVLWIQLDRKREPIAVEAVIPATD